MDSSNFYVPRSRTKKLLFHYTSKHRAIETIFQTMKIRMGPIISMNDPRETDPWLLGWDFESPILYMDYLNNDDKREELSSRINKRLKAGCNLLCLTEDEPSTDPDKGVQGFAHDRMWAQYADNHTGVCIFFDKEKLSERISDHFRRKKGKLHQGSIEYSNQLDFGEIRINGVSEPEGLEEALVQHRHDYAQKLYMTKTPDWRSEQEYRYLWISDSQRPKEAELVSIDGCVTGICVGARFPKSYELNMEAIANRIQCPLHRIIYLQGKLLISPFDQKYYKKLPKVIRG